MSQPGDHARIGDLIEETCDECEARWKLRIIGTPIAIFLSAPNPPVGLTPADKQTGSPRDQCPKDTNCATWRRIRERLETVPEYAAWRRRPEVAEWYSRLHGPDV
jgi:hypothetical protein